MHAHEGQAMRGKNDRQVSASRPPPLSPCSNRTTTPASSQRSWVVPGRQRICQKFACWFVFHDDIGWHLEGRTSVVMLRNEQGRWALIMTFNRHNNSIPGRINVGTNLGRSSYELKNRRRIYVKRRGEGTTLVRRMFGRLKPLAMIMTKGSKHDNESRWRVATVYFEGTASWEWGNQ